MERTTHHTVKVRQLSTGLVFERAAPDASELVATREFELCPAAELSIADRLRARPDDELQALPGHTLHHSLTHSERVAALVPLVELGVVKLA